MDSLCEGLVYRGVSGLTCSVVISLIALHCQHPFNNNNNHNNNNSNYAASNNIDYNDTFQCIEHTVREIVALPHLPSCIPYITVYFTNEDNIFVL